MRNRGWIGGWFLEWCTKLQLLTGEELTLDCLVARFHDREGGFDEEKAQEYSSESELDCGGGPKCRFRHFPETVGGMKPECNLRESMAFSSSDESNRPTARSFR